MTTFTYKEKSFYIDERLKNQLDAKVFPELSKKDKDVVFIVDGKERIGKSKFADILAAYAASKLGTDYNLSCMCMTPEEFRNKVQNANKNECVIYDEAHRGMGSRRALSEINNILVDLMMEMGQKNLFVVIVLPTFFMLDRYPALYRAKGLFHIYERKRKRGFWVYFNEKKKQELFMKGKKMFDYNCITWSKFRGRFYDQYCIDEEEYRNKKEKSFNTKARITRAESFMDQRNGLLYYIHKNGVIKEGKVGISATKMSSLLKPYGVSLTQQVISEILKEKESNNMENTEDLTYTDN